jgi:arsenate reductase
MTKIVFNYQISSEGISMNAKVHNVLFLCTGNSARSILAEAALGVLGAGRFQAFSAGSHPSGAVQPMAAEIAEALGYPREKMRSKSWEEFSGPDAPVMDLIITVCDNAAGESCPLWLGHPATAHWGVPDPVGVQGSEEERRAAFRSAYATLRRRVELLLALPIDKLERLEAQTQVRAIGQAGAP